jgi:hypothetical protein
MYVPVSKLPRSKYWIVIAIVSVLASCDGDITVRIIDVSLIDQPETFAKGLDTITVVGLLKAKIETNFDVIEYAKANERNLWYKVSGCESGVELDGWSQFYKVPSTQADVHKYMVVFDYKSLPKNERKYNLALQPEPLCFTVGIADMNVFTARKSRDQRYELSEQLKQALLSYEQGEGAIMFERKKSTSSAH